MTDTRKDPAVPELPTAAELTASAIDRLHHARSLTDASTNSGDPAGTIARAGLHIEMARVYAQLAANAQAAEAAVKADEDQDPPF
ncbi:hypothetical protein ACWEP8_39725 [Streptomyces hydrogenans]